MERFETDHSACGVAVSGLGASRRLYLPAKIGQEMCLCGGGRGCGEDYESDVWGTTTSSISLYQIKASKVYG